MTKVKLKEDVIHVTSKIYVVLNLPTILFNYIVFENSVPTILLVTNCILK